MERAAFAARAVPVALIVAAALLIAPARSMALGDAVAGPADAGAAADSGIRVRVQRSAQGLEVEGHCLVRAPAAVAWEVLTDYDGIARFVSSMRESRVTSRADHHLLVEQVGVSRLFLFTRSFRATLFVEEVPPDTIRFEDVLGKDFDRYRGEWALVPGDDQVELVYRLAARPHTSVPDRFVRGLFGRTARDLLAQVRAEIERRAVTTASPATARPASVGGGDSGDGAR